MGFRQGRALTRIPLLWVTFKKKILHVLGLEDPAHDSGPYAAQLSCPPFTPPRTPGLLGRSPCSEMPSCSLPLPELGVTLSVCRTPSAPHRLSGGVAVKLCDDNALLRGRGGGRGHTSLLQRTNRSSERGIGLPRSTASQGRAWDCKRGPFGSLTPNSSSLPYATILKSGSKTKKTSLK